MKQIFNFATFRSTSLLLFSLIFLLFDAKSQVDCTFPTDQKTLCQQFGEPNPASKVLNILQPTNSSSLLISTFSGVVNLNSTLTVDNTFTLSGCIVKCGSSGKIIVNTGSGFGSPGFFTSTGSKYFCCTALWQGLDVIGSGKLVFTKNEVEDAFIPIKISSNNANVTIKANVFNRNQFGIWSSVVANAIITDNTFDCTSNINTSSNPARSLYGINVTNNGLLKLGVGNQPNQNTIRRHQTGANVQLGSTLSVLGGTFQCNSVQGIAVRNSTLNIGNPNSSQSSTTYFNLFENNLKDIVATRSNLEINSTEFINCIGNNISSKLNTTGQKIFINNNFFQISPNSIYDLYTKIGIDLDRTSGTSLSSTGKVNYNIFNIADNLYTGRTAVKVVGQPGTTGEFTLNNNRIEQLGGGSDFIGFQIIVNSAPGFKINDNMVFTNNTDPYTTSRWAFNIKEWKAPSMYNDLIDNVVMGRDGNGNDQNDYSCCSFHFTDAGPWNACHNETGNTYRGFHIQGECGPSLFRNNIIGAHSSNLVNNVTAGFLIDDNAVIGSQYCHNNEWIVPSQSPSVDAWHKSVISPINPNKFTINQNWANGIPSSMKIGDASTPIINTLPNDWFTKENCTDAPVQFCDGDPKSEFLALNAKDVATIAENQIYTANAKTYEWENRVKAMETMIFFPVSKENNAKAESFYELHKYESEGQYASFSKMLHDAMLLPVAQSEAIDLFSTQTNDLLKDLDDWDATLGLPIPEEISDEFFSGRYTILKQIGNLLTERYYLDSIILQEREPLLNACEDYNSNLPVNSLIEKYQQFLNTIAIKKARGLENSEEDIATLREIAKQCELLAGSTKNKAMSCLPTGDPAIVLYDDLIKSDCSTEGRFQTEQKPQINNSDLTLFPNPVMENLNVQFNADFKGSITIVDLMGKVVFDIKIVDAQKNIQISTKLLQNGVYFLKTRDEKNAEVVSKFLKLNH
jgi:Secretion system C-terminal sorting domain